MGTMIGAATNYHDYLVTLMAVGTPFLLAWFIRFLARSVSRAVGDQVEAVVQPKIQEVHDRIDTHMEREEAAMNLARAQDEWQANAIMLIAKDRGMEIAPPPIWIPPAAPRSTK